MHGIRPHRPMSPEESEERRRLLTHVHVTAEAIADAFAIPLELLSGPPDGWVHAGYTDDGLVLDDARVRARVLDEELDEWESIASHGIGRRWPYQGRF